MKRVAYREMFNNELDHAWYVATRMLAFNYLKKNLTKNSRILDAGCGTGGTIQFLHNRGFKNIYGIDKSAIALNYCKKRGILNVTKGNINKLPYSSDSFDAVICLDVLYHQGVNPDKALMEINRVLKKGGTLYIQEPAFNFLRSRHDVAISTRERFTSKHLKKKLEAKGFVCKKITYYNTFLFILMGVKRLMGKYKKREITSDVQRMPIFINQLLLKILAVESMLIKKTSFPFGLSIITISQKQ